MTTGLWLGSRTSPRLSDQERIYLRDRVLVLEALAAHFEERASASASPDANSLLRRAVKNRSRAHRLRDYVGSSGSDLVAVHDVQDAPGS